ncbi:MAG: hypothetical protein WAT92_10440 [Saprospiraceae bacterium]
MNKSDKLELTSNLLAKLDPYYSSKGFTRTKKITGYQKEESQVLWGPLSIHIDSLTFRPWFKFENKDCSNVFKLLFPNEIGVNTTLIRSQSLELCEELNVNNFKSEYMIENPHGISYYYSIEKSTILDPIIDDHINYMNMIGLVLFEKVNSLQGVNHFLNNSILSIDRDSFYSKAHMETFKKFIDKRDVLNGIVSAYLIKDPDLEEILERYKLLFNGNNYILNDVMKIEEYFINKVFRDF